MQQFQTGGPPHGPRTRGGVAASARPPQAAPHEARRHTTGWLPRLSPHRSTCCYLAFAGYALAAGLLGGDPLQRWWGLWAAAGYAAAALAALLWRSRGRDVAVALALAGGIAAPLAWQQVAGHGTGTAMESAIAVVARSARLLLAHGSPYLPAGHLVHPLSYDPYLPAMAVFGLPGALGLPGAAGNPRLWFALAAAVALWLAFRRAAPDEAFRLTAFAVGSPVLAFGIATGSTDVPVLALLCLAFALAGPGRAAEGPRDHSSRRTVPCLVPAGLLIGAACAMKATAWPALAVLAAMLAARGGRDTLRFLAAAAGAGLAGLLMAPALLASPASLARNTVLFPLGLTRQHSPAASPLPGHLLATAGAAWHWTALGLLAAAATAIAVSLIRRPPAATHTALTRLAIGMTLLIALAPATRWGYLAYPAGLLGWRALNPTEDDP